MELKKEEELMMKLLHFFITKYNYNPVVLHGAKNEVWLENMSGEYKIIRLVSNYIHNDDQLNYDLVKTNHISKSIKKKTFTTSVPVLSIFINLGENVNITDYENIKSIHINKIKDVNKYQTVLNMFPDINDSFVYEEKGMVLFTKLSNEINMKAKEDSLKNENVFTNKKPYITYFLIAAFIIVYLAMFIFGNGSMDTATLIDFGANNRVLVLEFNQYYRLITSAFLHADILHLSFNAFAIYVIGRQVENVFGKIKYLIILLISILSGSLLSIIFSNSISVGVSGAIFGLLGALVYFGFHYRIYMGTVVKSQIIPIIILNLFLGFMISGIDNAAHIGGLIGGLLISAAIGVKYKSSKSSMINGSILTLIYFSFLIYLLFQI